ncbi:hypothetical protein AcW1_001530 [Taiwanofungus camphoratus]|nr:hypothetical protein AcV5_000431 [Antrodia cinnamomea]KAI0945275.1 hypothetical protein AcW1_001530 [Antrodia cinnamomea]
MWKYTCQPHAPALNRSKGCRVHHIALSGHAGEDYGEDVVSTFLEDSSRIELLRHVIKLSVIHTPDFVVLQALSEDRMSASSYTSWPRQGTLGGRCSSLA